MRQIYLILFYVMIMITCYAQKQPIMRYYGEYSIDLYFDNTYFLQSRLSWNYGKFEWSDDTIFFRTIPIYDTILVNTPDSTRTELILSEDKVSSVIGEIKVKESVFGFDKEKGNFNVKVPLSESTLPKEMIVLQSLKKFPPYLIKKRNKLGLYNLNGRFIEVGRKVKIE